MLKKLKVNQLFCFVFFKAAIKKIYCGLNSL